MKQQNLPMDKNFVCTTDEETKNKLLEEGFILLEDSNGRWTFLNEGKMNFSNDNKKIVYTNTLCF